MDSLWTSLLVTLAPLVVWLVAVFFSYKQYKEMQKQTEALQKQVEELQKKPDLKVELNPTLFESVHPYFNKNSTSLPVEVMDEKRDVGYVKLEVCNKGDATAKECSAKVEIIEKEPPNRVIMSIVLKWDTGGDHKLIDIPVNDCEMAVLMEITDVYESKPTQPMHGSLNIGMVTFYEYKYITNKENWIYGKDKKLKITVYCENATSKPVYLIFIKSPKPNEIINSKNISEFIEIEKNE